MYEMLMKFTLFFPKDRKMLGKIKLQFKLNSKPERVITVFGPANYKNYLICYVDVGNNLNQHYLLTLHLAIIFVFNLNSSLLC